MNFFIFFLIIFFFEVDCWSSGYVDPDSYLSLNDLVVKLGYGGIQTYTITTKDGYILNVFRIKREGADKMVPVLLVHALIACADSYFARKDISPAIFLADNGYDVWLSNHRGSKNSLGHVKWNYTSDREYWTFSWEEMGVIDMPATVDLVLKHNQHDKVSLIGHSQGSTIILVFLSELPEYNEKVSVSFHWAVGYPKDFCVDIELLKSLCRTLTPSLMDITSAVGYFGMNIFPRLQEGIIYICQQNVFKSFCFQGARTTTDSDERIDDVKDWSFFVSKALCSGSAKEVTHLMQASYYGRFAKFNYGKKKNLELYGSTQPPLFNLSNLYSPTVLWCGKKDLFCAPNNVVQRLKTILPNVISDTFKGEPFWTHFDFLVANDAVEYVFVDMLNILKRYAT